jgi:drug/metabolite transporter (DMT)-like permease
MTVHNNLQGIALMTAATAAFIINDTILKFVMADIPPFETLFLRGVATVIVGVPLLVVTGQAGALPKVLDPVVMGRNAFELLAVLGYILGLAYAPIADVTALSQLAPMLLSLAAVWFFGTRMGRGEIALICLAFFGALMVAQPGGSGFSAFALFGLWNAVCCAARDLIGKQVHAAIPGLVIPLGAGAVVMVGAAVATFAFERFVWPDGRVVAMLFGSAAFLTVGHLFIFLAFRRAEVAAVTPFFYTSTIWALLAGAVAFGTIPNALALAGIALIVLSGVGVVIVDARRRRLIAPAVAAS